MARQREEGVYLYIAPDASRYIVIVDSYGMANMLPWKQPGETDNIVEKSWNLQGDFVKLSVATK